ncbi:hypothetical protein AVEN_168270-1 [Araneus ventricosus]|uniref:Uncharacterized protein n=1 Tax=Araneus ventricosus TaxID=182803 RepID=A0A4Y2FZU6_ARAVE|nr:hypothetical protein AVEN_168270-1 [Araneus ventricosus]
MLRVRVHRQAEKIEIPKYLYENRPVGEISLTSRIIENDVLFQEYSRKNEAEVTRETACLQISSTSGQKATNNNRNSTNNNTQCLTADQFALREKRSSTRTRLQRDPKDVQSHHHLSNSDIYRVLCRADWFTRTSLEQSVCFHS